MTGFRFVVLLTLAAGSLVAQTRPRIQFQDITKAAGIDFVHNNGAKGKKYLPETMGPGVAFIDYDGDGWPDIFLVNGANWPGDAGPPTTSRLYRNQRDGTFIDVTRRAGLAVEFYGMGAAVADYDNDGDEDLFVSAVGQDRLFRNEGDGSFTDRTRAAGMSGPEDFSASAAWSDYDNDGDVDLFVANYVKWSIKEDKFCSLDGKGKSYCTPESYEGDSIRLWRNEGNGTFTDATKGAGLLDPTSKALGLAVVDFDQDNWQDLLVANDTERNKLYRNQRDGTFREIGVLAGVAFSDSGVARAGMGVDAADYDRSGYPSIVIGNFSDQMLALYHNEGNGLFTDVASRSPVGRNSLLTLAFACLFFDYDLDGWLDILAVNGHLEEGFERVQSRTKFAQPPHVFRNLAGKTFEEVTSSLGSAFAAPRVARAAAHADIDRDGDLDLLITVNGGRAVLFRNDGKANRSLRLRLVGTKSNRSGIGARVTVTAGAGRQMQTLHSGAGYLSESEHRLTFGLGSLQRADSVEVRWPGGVVDRIANAAADRLIAIEEGRGAVSSEPLGGRM